MPFMPRTHVTSAPENATGLLSLNLMTQWLKYLSNAKPQQLSDDVATILIIPADQITQKRVEKNCTVLDLAELCYLTTQQIRALESGDTSPFSSEAARQQCYGRVALALGIEPNSQVTHVGGR